MDSKLVVLAKEIGAKMAYVVADIVENAQGDKAAGVRARRGTKELEKLMREYRKESVRG